MTTRIVQSEPAPVYRTDTDTLLDAVCCHRKELGAWPTTADLAAETGFCPDKTQIILFELSARKRVVIRHGESAPCWALVGWCGESDAA